MDSKVNTCFELSVQAFFIKLFLSLMYTYWILLLFVKSIQKIYIFELNILLCINMSMSL